MRDDLPVVRKDGETKTSPRLSLAFARVALCRTELSEFSSLQFLIEVELARKEAVRQLLYGPLANGTRMNRSDWRPMGSRGGLGADTRMSIGPLA
jgi:hypothetical protein